MLLSPAVNVVVIVIVPVPPQHAAGKAVFELAPNDAEKCHLAAIQTALPRRGASCRIVAFKAQIEVWRRERDLAARTDMRRAAFVEQLEDGRLGAFANQTVAADGCRLVAD